MFRLTAPLLSVALIACTSPPPPDGTDHSAASATPAARSAAPIGSTESASRETPTPTSAPFEPGPGPDGWGPLAIMIAGLGDAFARMGGELEITDHCTYVLDRHGEIHYLLGWSPEDVRWDAARGVIVFRNPPYRDPPGVVVELHDGQHYVFGGGIFGLRDDAASGDAWTVPPHPSCSAPFGWDVDAVDPKE